MMTYNDYLKSVMAENSVTVMAGARMTQNNLKEALSNAGVEFASKSEFDAINAEKAKSEVNGASERIATDNDGIESAKNFIQEKISEIKKLTKRIEDSKDPAIKREAVGDVQVEQKRIARVFEKVLADIENIGSASIALDFLKWARQRRLVKDNTRAYHMLNKLLLASTNEDDVLLTVRVPMFYIAIFSATLSHP